MAAKILSDHIRNKKKLVTPINHLFNMQETNYGRETIPEIIWIDFLIEAYGLKQTVSIIEALTDGLKSININLNCCIMSCYDRLTDEDKTKFLDHSSVKKVIKDIQDALIGFNKYFPNAPVNFLLTTNYTPKTIFISNLKQALIRILDARSIRTTHALSCMFYAQAYAGHLFMSDNTERFDLNEILQYPDTEESNRVAAFVRTSSKTFIAMINMDTPSKWPKYFWEGCYVLEPCNIIHLTDIKP